MTKTPTSGESVLLTLTVPSLIVIGVVLGYQSEIEVTQEHLGIAISDVKLVICRPTIGINDGCRHRISISSRVGMIDIEDSSASAAWIIVERHVNGQSSSLPPLA